MSYNKSSYIYFLKANECRAIVHQPAFSPWDGRPEWLLSVWERGAPGPKSVQ